MWHGWHVKWMLNVIYVDLRYFAVSLTIALQLFTLLGLWKIKHISTQNSILVTCIGVKAHFGTKWVLLEILW